MHAEKCMIAHSDLVYALSEIDSFIDVSEEDLCRFTIWRYAIPTSPASRNCAKQNRNQQGAGYDCCPAAARLQCDEPAHAGHGKRECRQAPFLLMLNCPRSWLDSRRVCKYGEESPGSAEQDAG